jgi:hypothetical protein
LGITPELPTIILIGTGMLSLAWAVQCGVAPTTHIG